MKRRILSERNLVIILFVMVFVIFSLAQEDTKKIEKMYQNSNSATASSLEDESPKPATQASSNKELIPGVQFR